MSWILGPFSLWILFRHPQVSLGSGIRSQLSNNIDFSQTWRGRGPLPQRDKSPILPKRKLGMGTTARRAKGTADSTGVDLFPRKNRSFQLTGREPIWWPADDFGNA